MIFKGIFTALITPFKDNVIDVDSLKKLIEKQISAGIDYIVIGGSTGEGCSLSEDEYYKLISLALIHSQGRIKIIAGMTGISTIYSTQKILNLSKTGIDGLMCTLPHYIRPTQEGLYQHFKTINDSTKLPIMLYIHPGRTGIDMSDDTLIRLSKLDNIVSVKDASNDIEKPLRISAYIKPNFSFLTGDDIKLLAYSANGGSGCVSVISNIFPRLCKNMVTECMKENFIYARQMQQKLLPLISAISMESNPIGIKCAANLLGLCNSEIRLPLTPAITNTENKIKQLLFEIDELENNA